MTWKYVKNKLPKPDSTVLISDNHTVHLCLFAGQFNTDGHCTGGQFLSDLNIVKWMYAPEPVTFWEKLRNKLTPRHVPYELR